MYTLIIYYTSFFVIVSTKNKDKSTKNEIRDMLFLLDRSIL